MHMALSARRVVACLGALAIVSGAVRPAPLRLAVRGGAEEADPTVAVGKAFSAGLKACESAVGGLEAELGAGKAVEDLGAKLGAAYDKALAAAGPIDDAAAAASLEAAVDASLESLFVKQLAVVRSALIAGGGSPAEADAAFEAAAAAAARPGSSWDASADRASLAAVLGEIASRQAKVGSVGAKAASQQQAYVQLFQLYQAQIAQLKQALGTQPAQLVAAYRVPDTDLALSASRQNDRTTLTLGCVPDDSAPLLGPQGFVRGVTPLNVGLTVNVHV